MNSQFRINILKCKGDNKDMESLFAVIDERATLRILLALGLEDKKFTSLLDELQGVGFNSLSKAITALKELDLINEKESPYRIREFNLTGRGKKAAEIILELKKLIEGESKE